MDNSGGAEIKGHVAFCGAAQRQAVEDAYGGKCLTYAPQIPSTFMSIASHTHKRSTIVRTWLLVPYES